MANWNYPYLRTLLVLGRASNLPTVWSNCLAGWWLGGGGSWSAAFWLCLAASCLYTGGMYLNDAFDIEFDRQHRKERPIPSGAIGLGTVWAFGLGWLMVGLALTLLLPSPATGLAMFLVFAILLYDAVHKLVAFSPVLMAVCRFFLFLMASATGDEGVTGIALWSAFALGSYIVGLSYVAKSESTRGALKYWPCLFLGAPLLLAWIVNNEAPAPYKMVVPVAWFALLFWVARCLTFTFWSTPKNVGRTVSGLLAGIVIVDLLAIGASPAALAFAMLVLFAAALLFQRHVPAT